MSPQLFAVVTSIAIITMVYVGGLHAVRDVSFSVAPAEIVGIFGPNGAGKSTLLKAISRAQPSTGTLELRGESCCDTLHYQTCTLILLGMRRAWLP